MQFRTTGAGVALQTVALTRPEEQNALEREVVSHDGRVFLTRSADHATLPTVQYYHIVTKPISIDTSGLENLASTLPSVYTAWWWNYVVSEMRNTAYYLAQGNLLKLVWTYPVLQVPAVVLEWRWERRIAILPTLN